MGFLTGDMGQDMKQRCRGTHSWPGSEGAGEHPHSPPGPLVATGRKEPLLTSYGGYIDLRWVQPPPMEQGPACLPFMSSEKDQVKARACCFCCAPS